MRIVATHPYSYLSDGLLNGSRPRAALRQATHVYVRFARAANAIDENRKDFHRVECGTVEHDPYVGAKGPPKLIQM
jgi:hypothetical protein